MTEQNAGQPPSSTPPSLEERALKESAWQVVQQGAQVVGELGGGIGGIAAAVHVATNLKRGGSAATQGDTPSPSPPPPRQAGDE
jgi:hypothetical protein